MKNKIFLILLLLAVLPLVSAEPEYYKVNQQTNLFMTCELNGATPAAGTEYNITIVYMPTGAILVNNAGATALGSGQFNYTTTFTNQGEYKIQQHCYNSQYSSTNQEIVTVNNTGKAPSGITSTSMILIIAVVVSIFIYLRVSKFFGSFMIFILGFGILFQEPEYGWIGWIVIASGFITLLYSIMSPGKRRRRRY